MINSAMLVTTCPECETTFRISVGILEKAGGQVRCGRCAKIFDANVDLREIDDAEAEAEPGIGSKIQLGLEAEAALSSDADVSGDPEEAAADESVAESTPGDDRVEETPDANLESDDATGRSPLPDWLRPIAQERRRLWPWAVAAGILCVTLAGQLTHRFRNELVSVPIFGTVLARAYAVADIDLVAPVDLDQFELLDLTALAEPAGEEQGWLIIETRVRNSGPNVQPFPHIFVRLVDRWEDTVAGRYFAPNEYTVSEVADYSRMNIGTTVDAQFIIMDPGPSATGFELELCARIVDGFMCESDTNFQ